MLGRGAGREGGRKREGGREREGDQNWMNLQRMSEAGPTLKSVLYFFFNACTDRSATRFYRDKMMMYFFSYSVILLFYYISSFLLYITGKT